MVTKSVKGSPIVKVAARRFHADHLADGALVEKLSRTVKGRAEPALVVEREFPDPLLVFSVDIEFDETIFVYTVDLASQVTSDDGFYKYEVIAIELRDGEERGNHTISENTFCTASPGACDCIAQELDEDEGDPEACF